MLIPQLRYLAQTLTVALAAMLVPLAYAQQQVTANEAALALGAAVANYRFEAIRALMPRLKDGLSGQEMNEILGDPKDSWRWNMVTVIAPKARVGLLANEAALALGAAVANYRFEAIRALALKIENPLSEVDINQVVGDSNDPWRPVMIKLLKDRTLRVAATSPTESSVPPSPTLPPPVPGQIAQSTPRQTAQPKPQTPTVAAVRPPTGSAQCVGPVANVQMRVAPTCEQAWAWHIFLTVVANKDFQARRDLIDAAEAHAEQGDRMFSAVVTVGNAITSLVPKKALESAGTAAGKEFVKNVITEGPWIALDLFVDQTSPPAQVQIAGEIATTIHSMYEAAITAGTEPWSEAWAALNLWSKGWTLLQTMNVTRSRQTLYLVQEFLMEYFKQGGDSAPIARSLGLPVNATIDQIVTGRAKQLKWGSTDYSASSAVQIIQAYRTTVAYLAAWCVKTGTCSAPNVQTYVGTAPTEAAAGPT